MRIAIASLAMFILSAVVNADDLTIISTVTRDSSPPAKSTSCISNDHLRMSQPDGNDVIFDLKSGTMTVIDANKKTYYVVTKQDLDDMAAMVKERMNSPEMKKAQEQMKNLPPEQQKRMQEMMGGMFAVEVKKEGTSRTIAGYHCENWSMTIGQFSKSEQCLTTELKFPEQAWQQYKSYYDSMRSMMNAMGPMAKGMESMREEMQKMKGFPLSNTTTTTVLGRKSVTTSEVTAVNRGPIPPSAWEIPAGYTRVESPMKKAMQKQGR